MSNALLKPCPFCGTIPTLEQDPITSRFAIFCDHPKCRIQPSTDFHTNRSVVTREWNRRQKCDEEHG